MRAGQVQHFWQDMLNAWRKLDEPDLAMVQEEVGRKARIEELQSRLQGTSTANANRWQRLQVRLSSP